MKLRAIRGAARTLALIITVCLGACDGISVTSSSTPRTAAMAVAFTVGSALGGDAEAFDKIDAAHIVLQRQSDGSVPYDQTIDLGGSGQDRRTTIEIDLTEDVEEFDLTVELLSGGQALFEGGSALTARKGEITSVDMTLHPVVASVQITPETLTLTALGDEVTVDVAALFTTGDTARSVDPQLTTLDSAVASVSGRTVTAHGEGATTVVARVGTVTATASVHVQAAVATVTVSPESDTIGIGEEIQLSADARDRNGHSLVRTATWSSSDASVASVDESGLTRGLSAGQATVTATVEGMGATTSITVVPDPVTSVEVLPSSARVTVGQTTRFSARLRTASGQIVSRPVQWNTSDAAIATVSSSGVAEGRTPGMALITASAKGLSGTAEITVDPAPVADLVAGAPIVTPASPTTTQNVSIQASITNVGTVVSGPFAWRIRVGTTTVASGDQSLEPDGSTTVHATKLGPYAAGTHTATLDVDYAGEVSESSESNNTASTAFTVGATEVTLTVTVDGLGSVVSSGVTPTINCFAATCSQTYPIGTEVTLTATDESPDFLFESWFGTGSGFTCTTSRTCVVAMDQDRTVRAWFSAPGLISVDPKATTFTMLQGGTPTPASQTITVSDIGERAVSDVSVRTTYSPSVAEWLSATIDRTVIDTLNPGTLTLSVIDNNLDPGSYHATVYVGNSYTGSNVDVTLTVQTPNPVISGVSGKLAQLNDSTFCGYQSPPGSLLRFSFSYTDPDGDVNQDQAVLTVAYQFNPGSSGQFEQPPQPGLTVGGNGYSGTITSYVCDVFGAATSVTHTFTLQDAQGHPSNSLSITMDRPEGSNVPRPPGSPPARAGRPGSSTSGGAAVTRDGEVLLREKREPPPG